MQDSCSFSEKFCCVCGNFFIELTKFTWAPKIEGIAGDVSDVTEVDKTRVKEVKMKNANKTILFAVTASVSLGFLNRQLRLLGERGWKTIVVSAPTLVEQLEKFAAQEGAIAFPVPLCREIKPITDITALWRIYQTIRKVRPKVVNVGTPKAGLLGGIAALLSSVPIRIYTLHGLRLETVTGAKRRLLIATERLAMACAHRVVCVSPSLRDRVHELRLAPAHKTVVLGAGSVNGIRMPDQATVHPQSELYRAALDLPAGTPVVGFVGRFTRDKGIAELLTAYQLVRAQRPEAKLLLVGDFEEGDPVAQALRREIETDPGVIRAGFVPDVTAYYPLMNVLALPTYREGLGLAILEAAALGVPAVTTDATGARDAVQPGITGWRVPVGDAQALALALLEALDQPMEAVRRGLAGQQWVRHHFSPEVVQERWADYYDELMEWRRLSRQNPEKRLFDLLIAGAGLIILSVPLAVLAGLVRSKLGSPVLFKQIRPGLSGQPFTMYKFRTMTDERGSDGELLPDGARITDFGKFLRATSLDELPGLVNVFLGHMSLVGPRPLLLRYTAFFTAEEARRLSVRPGITGWAQINGRNTVSWDERLSLDVWYVDNRSFMLDLRILWLTVLKVFKRQGVIVDPESLMQNLDEERRIRSIS